MSDNNFTTLYKTWSTEKLLDIVDNAGEYQQLAVEAARFELDSRQLTPEELEDAKAIRDVNRQDRKKQQKFTNFEHNVKAVGDSLAGTFNLFQKEIPNTHKLINLISLFIGGLFLYLVYKEFDLLKFIFTQGGGTLDLSIVLYFLPFIILPAAGLLFWFRKKAG